MMNKLFSKVTNWKGFALKESLINQRSKETTHRFRGEKTVSWSR